MKCLGFHIRILVLKFLLLYCRPLVEAGRVYCAISPLYHINKKKPNWKYFTDKEEFLKYVRDEFCKNYSISNARTGEKLNKTKVLSLVYNNSRYIDILEPIATTYAIHPVLLEDILIARSFEFKKFKKAIESKYRFMNVYQRNKITIIEGQMADKSHTIVLNQELSNACAPLLPFIDSSDKRYIMNGKKVGLYEIIRTFRDSEPKNIERAKGLGAMNSLEIGISTLSPENRKLLRYTTEDISKEIEEMRKINDDKFTLIKDIDISQYEF